MIERERRTKTTIEADRVTAITDIDAMTSPGKPGAVINTSSDANNNISSANSHMAYSLPPLS
jgi:hypothetical protein